MVLVLASCASHKPSIQTFYVDDNVQQYFIMPSSLKGPGCTVLMDFTYRAASATATINYTISAAKGVNRDYTALRFILGNGSEVAMGDTVVLMLNKGEKRMRLSSKLPAESFLKLLASDEISFAFSVNGVEHVSRPSPAFKRQIQGARLELIENE